MRAIILAAGRGTCMGETALLFPPLDEEAMREQLRRLVCEPKLRARLGRQAGDCVPRHHTWSQNAQRVLGQLALIRLGRGADGARHRGKGQDTTDESAARTGQLHG
jgi:glycosyltransferase involved in cell wall biosynthesis